MRNPIIVYYSFSANNEKLAFELQRRIGGDFLKIEEVKKRTWFTILLDLMFNRRVSLKPYPYYLRDYDHVYFVAPVWGGKIASPMKTFMLRERSNVKEYSFITICGGRPGQKEKLQAELTSILHDEPVKITELWISHLLAADKKDKLKPPTAHQITSSDLKYFERDIADFLKSDGKQEISKTKRTELV